MPREVLIFCDGGFANRIGSLVSGMALAKALGRDYVVLWPKNNRCGAGFDELFVPHCLALQVRLIDLVPYQDSLNVWMHENDVGFAGPLPPLRRLAAIEAAKSLDNDGNRPILFSENTFLPCLPEGLANECLNQLTFRPEIVAQALHVLNQHAYGPYFGIHLRGTDFVPPPPVSSMLSTVASNPEHRFFVCSDDPELERRFAEFPNVFVHPKTAYVEKLANGAWRRDVVDSDGLPYTSNIDRTSQSVLEACVDLLLLALSTTLHTSGSSFLALADRLRASGLVERHFFRRS